MKELEADKKQNQDCDVRHRARITDAQKKHAEELKKLHYLIFLTLNIFSLFLCKVLYYFLLYFFCSVIHKDVFLRNKENITYFFGLLLKAIDLLLQYKDQV